MQYGKKGVYKRNFAYFHECQKILVERIYQLLISTTQGHLPQIQQVISAFYIFVKSNGTKTYGNDEINKSQYW